MRWLARRKFRAAALALFVALYVASARYTVLVAPSPSWRAGVSAGALEMQLSRQRVFRGAVVRADGYPTVWWPRGVGTTWAFCRDAVMGPRSAPAGPIPGLAGVPVLGTARFGPVSTWHAILRVPLWVFGVVGAGACVAADWRKRRMEGRCAECRYDLKGVSGAVCPECGTALERARRHERGAGRDLGQGSKSGAASTAGAGLDSLKSAESAPSTRPS